MASASGCYTTTRRFQVRVLVVELFFPFVFNFFLIHQGHTLFFLPFIKLWFWICQLLQQVARTYCIAPELSEHT
jgi:hypothetical protein